MKLVDLMERIGSEYKVRIRTDGKTEELTPQMMAKYGVREVYEIGITENEKFFIYLEEEKKGIFMGCGV